MLVDVRRSGLLLVDFQARLFSAMTPAVASLLPRLLLLVQAARLLDIPLVVTRQYPRGLGPLLPEVTQALPPDLQPIDKMTFSCCAEPGLEPLFPADRDQILIAGIETHVCVLQTAFELHGLGKIPFVLDDVCASRSLNDHTRALARMNQGGIAITTVESVVFEWLRTAKHPRFREIIQAVKDLPIENGAAAPRE